MRLTLGSDAIQSQLFQLIRIFRSRRRLWLEPLLPRSSQRRNS